jgi:hypothetical protein
VAGVFEGNPHEYQVTDLVEKLRMTHEDLAGEIGPHGKGDHDKVSTAVSVDLLFQRLELCPVVPGGSGFLPMPPVVGLTVKPRVIQRGASRFEFTTMVR